MLVDCLFETPAALQPLATASARMYPEFVHELQIESGINVDLRDQGTILFPSSRTEFPSGLASCSASRAAGRTRTSALADLNQPAFYLQERSVDPRALTPAALQAAKASRRGHFLRRCGHCGESYRTAASAGVVTNKTSFHAPESRQLRRSVVGPNRTPRFSHPPR